MGAFRCQIGRLHLGPVSPGSPCPLQALSVPRAEYFLKVSFLNSAHSQIFHARSILYFRTWDIFTRRLASGFGLVSGLSPDALRLGSLRCPRDSPLPYPSPLIRAAYGLPYASAVSLAERYFAESTFSLQFPLDEYRY